MAAKKPIWELADEESLEIAEIATKKAIEKSHAAGLATTHKDNNGRLYMYYPDGRKVYVEDGESDNQWRIHA